MTDLTPADRAPATRDPTGWTVHTSWRAHRSLSALDSISTHLDWPTARRNARRIVCLAGARYVTVQDPTGVVVGDWDAYTNRWREYALHVGECDNYIEPDGPDCDGQLYAKPTDVQVRCPKCRGWTGYRAPGMRQPFEPRPVVPAV